jgi:acetyl-CoA synthetase
MPLKRNANNALRHCPEVRDVIVVRHTGGAVDWVEGRVSGTMRLRRSLARLPAIEMSAEDPLSSFIHRLDRTAEKYCTPPAATTCLHIDDHEYVFEYREGEVYWCTADVGWVTGHSTRIRAACQRATTLMFEACPTTRTVAILAGRRQARR